MHLVEKAVEDAHLVTAVEQGPGDVATDEAGAAGDQNARWHDQSPC